MLQRGLARPSTVVSLIRMWLVTRITTWQQLEIAVETIRYQQSCGGIREIEPVMVR